MTGVFQTFGRVDVKQLKTTAPLHMLLCDAAALALLPLETTVSGPQTKAVETEFLFEIQIMYNFLNFKNSVR